MYKKLPGARLKRTINELKGILAPIPVTIRSKLCIVLCRIIVKIHIVVNKNNWYNMQRKFKLINN